MVRKSTVAWGHRAETPLGLVFSDGVEKGLAKRVPCPNLLQPMAAWEGMCAGMFAFMCTDLRYRGGVVHCGKGEPAAFGVRGVAATHPGHWVGGGGDPSGGRWPAGRSWESIGRSDVVSMHAHACNDTQTHNHTHADKDTHTHTHTHTHDGRDKQGTEKGGLDVLDLVRCKAQQKQ